MSQNSGYGENINDYEVLGLLGKGGFATVYRALSKRNNQMVAIKMIDKKLIHSAGLTNRVRQEVEIHSRLKHPFVVELYTFFQDADYVYLVMELATNGELQRYMKEHMCRPMTENEAAAILHQVVSGILYLHSHRIMHRDISLSNLLLNNKLDVKIADFGLATQLKKHDEKHMTMCGTPNFISPEVASRSSHGLPADVWAIGCLLYTLLVGKPPFDTHAVQATLTKVVMSDFCLPEHLSYEAKDLINKLLKKDPNERIALQHIVKHPFMQRYMTSTSPAAAGTVAVKTYSNNMVDSSTNGLSHTTMASSCNHSSTSYDSGISTFASSSTSSSFRPALIAASGMPNQEMPSIGMQDCYSKSQSYNYQISTAPHSTPNTQCLSNEMDWLPTNNPAKTQWLTTSSACTLPTQQQQLQQQQNQLFLPRQYDDEVNGTALPAASCPNMIAGIPTAATATSTRSDGFSGSSCNSNSDKQTQHISVPPLNTARLQPTRFRNKNAVMSILQGGEVVVEFIKFRGKLNEDRITDVCWISKDGQRIVIYEPDPGRGLPIRNEPPELPQHDTRVGIFSYDNLPNKHWRKYLFASRFVSLVKASTPKVTFFSEQAKFHLMESMLHFEAIFYDGAKVTQSPNEGLKVYDRHGRLLQPHEHTTPTAMSLLEHQAQCLRHCEAVCQAMEQIQHTSTTNGNSFSCFPIIIGRRPNRERIGKLHNNVASAALIHNAKSNISNDMEAASNFGSYKDFKYVDTQRIAQYDENDTHAHPVRTVNLPTLGKATELSNGIVQVQFNDGSFISVASSTATWEFKNRNRITYVQSNGVATHFSPNDDLPLVVREKLQHIPHIEERLRNLKSSSSSTFNCSDAFSTPAAPKTARIYTSTPALNNVYSTPTTTMRYFR